MKKLEGWVFVYNTYTNKWMASKRDNYYDLFSNISSDKVLKSSNINTLIEIIIKTQGEKTKIKKLLANGK